MTRRSPVRQWILVMAAVLMVGVLARAGPIQTELPANIRSLRHLVRVRLRIEPMPEQLAALGVTAAAIEKNWVKVLQRGGIVVVDGEDADQKVPELRLFIYEIMDPAFPDAVAFSGALTVRQWVTVDRLDQSMRLPTYRDYLVGLETRKNVKSSVDRTLQRLIEQFIQRSQLAND